LLYCALTAGYQSLTCLKPVAAGQDIVIFGFFASSNLKKKAKVKSFYSQM
jgi:hypothetical protein